MPRAAKVCNQPGCTQITTTSTCPTHAPKPWSTGNAGRGRGGWAWTRQRTRQLEHDYWTCTQCSHHDPTGKTLDVDHDDNDQPRTLCKACHKQRTQAQAAAARRTPG